VFGPIQDHHLRSFAIGSQAADAMVRLLHVTKTRSALGAIPSREVYATMHAAVARVYHTGVSMPVGAGHFNREG
jgi:hypothetical protein